jgi:DNA-binding beta-propeller fold protein YncE
VWSESFSTNQIAGYTSAGNGILPVVGISNGGPGVPFILNPTDVAIDGSNNIFVANSGENNILEFDANGNPVGNGIFIPSGGALSTPTYLLWDIGVTATGGPGLVALVPEPSTLVLLGLGGITIAAYARRRRTPA